VPNLVKKLAVCLTLLGASQLPAYADESTGTPAPASTGTTDPAAEAVNPVSPIAIVQGTGVKVGESATVYPQVGLETGFVSNVFYDDKAPVGAGLLRVLGEVGIGSLSQRRLDDNTPPESSPAAPLPDRGGLVARADLYAAYDQYISGNDRVTSQGGLSGGAALRGVFNPNHPVFVSFLEHYERVIRATNFESSHDTNRDINWFTLRLNYQPSGRRLGGYVYYEHMLDLFEEDAQQFADRFDNRFGLRVNWQWLPITRLYVDVSEGVFTGVGSSSTKGTSYPLTAVAGIQTLLSLNTTFAAHVGYTQGFYSAGPSYASIVGGAQLGYRYSPLGRLILMYSYSHEDSINANFYRDHLIAASLEQQLEPVLFFVRPELRFREYQGIMNVIPGIMTPSDTRDDVIFALIAGVHYNFRDWLAITGEYQLAVDQTDFRYNIGGMTDDPSYVRHEALVGIRAAF